VADDLPREHALSVNENSGYVDSIVRLSFPCSSRALLKRIWVRPFFFFHCIASWTCLCDERTGLDAMNSDLFAPLTCTAAYEKIGPRDSFSRRIV